jgi:excisionase family DNA binding protein
MKRTKKMEVTLETHVVVIRHGTNMAPVWCIQCSSPVQLITPEEAAVRTGVDTRTVYRWVEAGKLHFIELATQTPLICINSLLKATEKGGNKQPIGAPD